MSASDSVRLYIDVLVWLDYHYALWRFGSVYCAFTDHPFLPSAPALIAPCYAVKPFHLSAPFADSAMEAPKFASYHSTSNLRTAKEPVMQDFGREYGKQG